LIATRGSPTVTSIFIKISETLKRFEFSNVDGSTFGKIATSSFDQYVNEFDLADVRSSHEKTIEGIILGEHMRNIKLYNESFTHAVGKYNELLKLGTRMPVRVITSHSIVECCARVGLSWTSREECLGQACT
jgi:hypothetical protein